MAAVFSFILGMLAVITAFGFIIFIHEMGHFLTARAVDIRCPQFAIGFGPSVFSFRWRGTNFAVRAFPLGGYVLMNGEEPGERTDDPWSIAVAHFLSGVPFPATPDELLAVLERVPPAERGEDWIEVRDQVAYARCDTFPNLRSVEGNFHDRSVGARILVISGGVLMNFAATILILWALAPMAGLGSFFADWSPVISQVVEGTPAQDAGLQTGDKILSVDGQPVETYLEAYHAIGSFPGVPVSLTVVSRDKVESSRVIRPGVAIGYETFSVLDDDSLILKDSGKQPEHAGKKIAGLTRLELIEMVNSKSQRQAQGYQVTFVGEEHAVTFELPQTFSGARGQIGVQFGVSDIRFETHLSGIVATVAAEKPAGKAGLKEGDVVVAVSGLTVESNLGQTFGSLIDPGLAVVSSIEQIHTIELAVLRGDAFEIVKIPKPDGITTSASLGFQLQPLTTGDLISAPFDLIAKMLMQPLMIAKAWLSPHYTTADIVQNLQGPIGIMQILFQLSDNGFVQFVFFVALLNAAIGAFNLLPFPALDGSRLVFLVIAAIRGKAVDPDKEARIHLAGLMLLLGFVIVVSFGDVKRLISSHLFVL